MTYYSRVFIMFSIMLGLLILVGVFQSWSLMLSIVNLCIISAIMALGVNAQWGYAGLFNVGTMGFAALGGLAAMLVSQPPVMVAWALGGQDLLIGFVIFLITAVLAYFTFQYMRKNRLRIFFLLIIITSGVITGRYFLDPAIATIESVNPAITGYLGGFGLPILFSWIIGGFFAAVAAWIIGKVALGLRSDYLAIATLGISEIIIAFLKNEDWLSRGVKNVTGLSRPVPYEIDLQESEWFISITRWFYSSALENLSSEKIEQVLTSKVIEFSTLYVKLCYLGLFLSVLIIILTMSILALNSPWGRMMRAIRDNETSAAAMGKNIGKRHLQVFVIGSAIVGVAGAMLTTIDGQLTPGMYNPLRFTFVIWVMVIVGGSGNNLGSVLGGFLIWFVWVEAEPVGFWLIDLFTNKMSDESFIKLHLAGSAQHMRLFLMGLVLLLVMRFNPGGLLPEQSRFTKNN